MAQIRLGMGADRLELYVTPTGIIVPPSAATNSTRVGRVGPLGVWRRRSRSTGSLHMG